MQILFYRLQTVEDRNKLHAKVSKEEEESSSEEEEEEMETEEMKGRQIYGVKEYICEFYFQIKIIKMWFDCQ